MFYFYIFIKEETKYPNNNYYTFHPACVLFKWDVIPLTFRKWLTNNIGKLSRKEIKLYITLVNNAYFAKAFLIHNNAS